MRLTIGRSVALFGAVLAASASCFGTSSNEPPDATDLDADFDGGQGADAASPDAPAPLDSPFETTMDGGFDATLDALDAGTPDGGIADGPCDGALCACMEADACSGNAVFAFTGAAQSFVVPAWITQVTISASGAAGGSDGCFNPAAGGTTTATIPVSPGETLTVYVGGAGAAGTSAGPGAGGFNGGGTGGRNTVVGVPTMWSSGGGGGASDVRRGGATLADRVVVAGGGGGAAGATGGQGGGATGATGGQCTGALCAPGGAGGTQATGGASGDVDAGSGGTAGSLGTGGDGAAGSTCNCAAGGGGGGGYYGGGGGGGFTGACASNYGGAGGGGSSFADPAATGITMLAGTQNGDGQVTIAYDE